ncbi:uncharacterized protein LOC118465294 isoform X8 [Anopheles albimanus]|uniref:uncharacterized protein LOC118465294 isoform X8 n=1 Tax=Anopheles albimanus TaxID=7167 RepID=UPI001640FAA2|nr:uncharacterized protein LOC118465294 isoform X8 [Anopheles albimanus]
MKCSSCIGGGRRSLSSSDHESSSPLSSPVTKANQLEQNMAENSQKPRGSEDSSTSRPPSITIEELDDDVFDSTKEEELHRHTQRYTQELNDFEDSFSYQLAPPSVARLEVIREEDSGDACSDCSDNENPEPRDDSASLSSSKVKQFSPAKMLRDLLRYRRGRSKQRHFERQEQTTCLLVGAKESTIVPTEYRSVCTTETVDCEKSEVELVYVGSNSSSMDDLSDMDEGAPIFAESQNLNSLQFNGDFEFSNSDTVDSTIEADDDHIRTKSLNQALDVNQISITEIDNDRDSTQRDSHRAIDSPIVEQQITESTTVSSNDQQACAAAPVGNSHGEDRQRKAGRRSPEAGEPATPHLTSPPGLPFSSLRSTPNERFEDDVDGMCDRTNGERSAEDSLVVTDDEKMRARTMLEVNRARAELSSSEPVAKVRDRVLSATDVKENVTELFSACSSTPDIDRAGSCYAFGVPCVHQVDSSIVVNHSSRNEEPCFGKIMTVDNGVGNDIEEENSGVVGTPECTSASPLAAEGTPLPQNPLAKEKTDVESTPSESDVSSVTNLAHSADQISGPPVPPPLPPPPAAVLLPLTVEALSAPSAPVSVASNDGQIHSGDHSRKADHADADPNSTQDSVSAVVLPVVTTGDQSVLLKYIQEDIASTGETEGKASSFNSRNSRKKSTEDTAGKRKPIAIPRSNSGDPGKNNGDHGPKIERSHAGGGSTGQYFIKGGTEAAAPHIQTTVDLSQKVASGMIEVGVVHAPVTAEGPRSVDLRSEVTRIKDQELHDEFRKLELETARYEHELQQMSLPSLSSNSYRKEHVASDIEQQQQHRTVSVATESSSQVRSSSSSNTAMTTDVRMRNGSTIPVPLPNRNINDGNNKLYHEWQNKMKDREVRLVQQTGSSLQQQKETTSNPLPMAPPIVPAPPNVEEEHVTMKVKDRVREFMASEAAKCESRPMIRGNGMSSAPATPTASRKHIEAEFQQFREIRAQEQQRGLTGENLAAKQNDKTTNGLPSQPTGVWSPFNRSTEVLTKEELAERTSNSKVSEPLQPVWVPRSAPPSPAPERREFRPIGFESPTPSRRALASPSPAAVAAPWTQPGYTPPLAVSDSKLNPSSNASSSIRCGTSISTPSQPQGYGQQVRFAPQPRSAVGAVQQEPTINSLLKSKDGKVAVVEDAEMAADRQTSATTVSKRTTSSNQQHQLGGSSNRTASPAPRTGYSSSGARNEGPQNHQMQQMVHKVAGIGPTTREGMPLTLRSEIEEGNRDKWYKQMYQTLHKAHDDDDYVTVRYKTRKGYPYKSSGYQSEPEPNYDSDYTIKYSTLDRRRTPIGLSPTSYNKFNTQQQTTQLNQPIKSGSTSYKNHPGRIENYTPGRSSISEKESKAWWDEVMDIFNGQLEHQKLTTSKTYTEGNLSRALKEQGYESDSTLVFRKREPLASAALSPVEQKQYYKTMQAGGEIPLQGFRKPAPEKPKEPHLTFPSPPMKGAPTPPPPPIPLLPSSPIAISSNGAESPRRYIESDVNIHYKTPIRFEYKEPIPDDELAYRQAEHMRRVYQEERRRKYINELEDMHSRRHADNILPSQKSPIPLNRYDDFAADLSPKPLQQQQPKTIARALYNFQGQSIRELSFRKGDIIYLRRQIDKNWYEGEHNATVGLLPANYIEILTKDNVNLNAKPLPRKPTREGKARAKFNFTAQTAVELSLLKGELVTLTRRVDENWFEGKIGSKKGIFPVSYVEILTDIDGAESYEIEPIVKAATQSFTTHYGSNGRISPGIVRETKTVQKTEVLHVDTSNEPISYRALYNYKPQNTDELELHEGDIVYVLEKCDDGWYVGTSARTGCFGTFPGNYVNKL